MTRYFKVDDFRLNALKLTCAAVDLDESLAPLLVEMLRLPPGAVEEYRILNKSVDARRGRPEIVYSLLVGVSRGQNSLTKFQEVGPEELAAFAAPGLPEFFRPDLRHVVVVGTGPAGLFAAYRLALAGCEPIVLDRGFEVERRRRDIEAFERSRNLNCDSNYLIGEGGAGTFSDGKLYTRIRDPRAAFVLQEMINAGAPAEIAYLKRPHIGSDRLPLVVAGLRRAIIAGGGSFRFGCGVEEVVIRSGHCLGVKVAGGETITAPAVLIAPGLGGRPLIQRLVDCGVEHQLKPFQIGCRIEHEQSFIDHRQYHVTPRPAVLGAAEYNMVCRPGGGGRTGGVSTFCMCPGGEIVFASATCGRLSTNGMSNYRRDGRYANSCLIVTSEADRFTSAADAFAYLADLEGRAFEAGGGDCTFPAQDAAAFLQGTVRLKSPDSSTAFGLRPAAVDRLLPDWVTRSLRGGLRHFDRLMPGFVDGGKLIGIESFVSSPVRFRRDPETLASSVSGLYIAGEGAGMAGGIISAAVDGLKCAEALLRHYAIS